MNHREMIERIRGLLIRYVGFFPQIKTIIEFTRFESSMQYPFMATDGGSMRTFFSAMLMLSISANVAFTQQVPAKVPVLLDFDIGEDIDDTFALATVLASPELDLRGVTTVGEDAHKRAQMAARFLAAVDRGKVPVSAGLPETTTKPLPYWQVQYGNHATVYYRDPKPAKERAPAFLYKHLKAQPGELTILAVGPLTNIAKLLTEYPDVKPMIKRIVLMGGSVHRGYGDGSKPQAEYNIAADPKAAQIVFRSGIPLVMAPLDATAMVKLDAARQKKLFDTGSLLTLSVQALTQLWREKNDPILYDPVAVTLVHTEKFCTMENLAIEVDAKGFTRIAKDAKPNARVATSIKTDAFLDWLGERLANAYPKALPTMRVINESKLVPRLDRMPGHVHVFEDFESDIEKRWWLSGRIETANVPPGSKRALRAVLTQDFDDRQGETKTLYNAVVFNPVPGPPMRAKTHLSFRYWLKGTDTLRVQLYSLSNGYHRCLMLTGLPQGKWQEGNVDMTQMRKPDGTGGPLAENERIDDIQFYADPRAELLIDDIVLYDAGDANDRQPFPKRFLFTGWFDSGKQGKEWPGDFEIDPKKGHFWHAAKAIPHPKDKDVQHIRIGLRGPREVGDALQLAFRYKLVGANAMTILLDSANLVEPAAFEQKSVPSGTWSTMEVNAMPLKKYSRLRPGDTVHEVVFRVPAKAQLWVDDLLLYEPDTRKK
jgi:purine nucleosidase